MLQQNKNYRTKLSVAVFLCIGVFSAAFANASESVTDLSKEQKAALEDKQDQLDAINKKIKAYNQIINLKQRQGSTLNDQIQSLEAQANKLELEISLNKRKIEDLEGDVSSLSARITEKEDLINRQKQMLSELMRIYYDDYSSNNATIILSANETLSYLNREGWTTEVNGKVSDLLDSVKTLRESLVGERAALEEKKKEADTLHIQLTERNDYLESAKENKAGLLAKTQAEVNKYDTLVDDLQKQRDDIQQEIENIEAGKIDQLTGLPSGGSGVLSYPVSKVSISQGYGKTSFSKNYTSGKHNGIDFTGKSGTPILAAADGKVVGTGNLGNLAYGRWITIDHGNGLVTLYGHLSSIGVSKGEKVRRGESIGKMGSTGYSTGTHVHFTVYATNSYEVVSYKGKSLPVGASVNPKKYLP